MPEALAGGRRRALIGAGLVLAGVALGLGSAALTVRIAAYAESTRAGAWRVNLAAGGADAGLYTRALVAVVGLLALNREETLYYLAEQDDSGRALDAQCAYRVSGTAPSARWWSITAYGGDYFLFPSPNRRYSFNMKSVEPDAQGRFAMVTGPSAREGRWLPTPGSGRMVLALRLYNAAPAIARDAGSLDAPRIERTGDCP